MGRNLWTITVATALVLMLGVYTVFFSVSEGTASVVYRLGEINRIRHDPGPYLKWPWPFETVESVDNRTRVLRVESTETTTGDAENNFFIAVSAGWRIRQDPESIAQYLTRLGNAENARQKLEDRIRDARQKSIQKIKLQDIISTGAEQARHYADFENDLKRELQEGLADEQTGYGIEISFLKVESIKFPEEVTKQVTELMIKDREQISKDLIAQGNNNAEILRTEATLYREEKLKQAEGDAIRIRGEGDAKAAEFYKVFDQSPELADFLKGLDTLRLVLEGKSTVIVLPADDPLRYLLEKVPALK